MKKALNIGIIGSKFMGRAHSNAWHDVQKYYTFPFEVVLKAACDIDPASEQNFAKPWGWESFHLSWKDLIGREDIDVVDICTPNNTHKEIAVAAAKSGKHIICEKPAAMNSAEAMEMLNSAEMAGVKNMIAFNYRRVPAIVLAKNLIMEGKIGEIFHFNAVYYQDWLVDPEFPWVWRHDVNLSGSGAHGDMNAHTVDLARYLVGEIQSVCGQESIFIPTRKNVLNGQPAQVTVDDAVSFLARFENGASGNFMATRFATGRKNFLRLEIFGSKGGLIFNLERLNELQYFSRLDDPEQQGFKTILVTENVHPYLNKWWPPGHIIGWEHTFIHEFGDFLMAIAEGKTFQPDFNDGYRTQIILDKVIESARSNKWLGIQ